jgi:hypothetical protein
MKPRWKIHIRSLLVPVGLLACLAAQSFFAAAAAQSATPRREWTVHTDNDLFAFTHADRDYTAGASVTISDTGPRGDAGDSGCAERARSCGPFRLPAPTRTKAIEFGLLLFTPEDLAAKQPLTDDRPYASLLYAARSTLAHEPLSNVAYQSTLTIGLLGLRLAEQVHRGVHSAVGSTPPMGYGHQISDGGEPTFRYARSRYRLLAAGRLGAERYTLRFDTTVSAGFLTEVNAALGIRWGNGPAQWWESLADEGDYAGQPALAEPTQSPLRRRTFAVTAGVKLRGRLYDSFLQGQLRQSDVAYSSSAIEHVLGEAWLGVDVRLEDRLRLSYVIRRQNRELAAGKGARISTWAGLSISGFL